MGPPRGSKAALLEPPRATKTSLVFSGARIAVVVPARDEARWIAEVVRGVPPFVDDIVLVDDGSGDDTTERARSTAEPRLTLLRHGTSKGVGAAIVSGYREALARGADVIAVMAGDGQIILPDRARRGAGGRGPRRLREGDRFAHPDVTRTMPLARHAAGRTFASVTRSRSGSPAPLRLAVRLHRHRRSRARAALRPRRAVAELRLPERFLLGALARQRLRVHEVVVRPIYRGEASGIRPWHVATVGWLIGRIAVRRVVSNLPPRGVASTG